MKRKMSHKHFASFDRLFIFNTHTWIPNYSHYFVFSPTTSLHLFFLRPTAQFPNNHFSRTQPFVNASCNEMHFSSAHKRVKAQKTNLFFTGQTNENNGIRSRFDFMMRKTFCTSKFLLYVSLTQIHNCTRILRSFIIHSKRSLSVAHCTNHTFRLSFSFIVLGVRYCFVFFLTNIS